MRNNILLLFIAVVFQQSLVYGQTLSLASMPNQPIYEISVNQLLQTQYSSYNFTNLDPKVYNRENSYTNLQSAYGGQSVHVGPLMIVGGILTVLVGGIGMDISKNGIDNFLANNNGNNNGNMQNWKSYNTYCDVALAGGALIVSGLIVAAANGDLRGGHYEGFRSANSGGYSSGWWIFGRHHEHFGHREHGHHWGGGHKSHSFHPRGHSKSHR